MPLVEIIGQCILIHIIRIDYPEMNFNMVHIILSVFLILRNLPTICGISFCSSNRYNPLLQTLFKYNKSRLLNHEAPHLSLLIFQSKSSLMVPNISFSILYENAYESMFFRSNILHFTNGTKQSVE